MRVGDLDNASHNGRIDSEGHLAGAGHNDGKARLHCLMRRDAKAFAA